MRSQLGHTYRILGLTGRVASRSDTGVFIEFEGGGFLSVVSQTEGDFEAVVTITSPDWAMISRSDTNCQSRRL